MKRSIIKTVLVIGDNHQDIIKKYSADTKVEPYVCIRRCDALALLNKKRQFLKELLSNEQIILTNFQQKQCKELYLRYCNTTEEEYYDEITQDLTLDPVTQDAISNVNPNAFYKNEKCYQDKLEKSGEESIFSNPFILKDGSKSYIAHYDDIDWNKMHLYNTELYRRAWELCVDNDEPKNETEVKIKENMQANTNYFHSFENCDEYITHSCSFWCYGVATDSFYAELDTEISDKVWVSKFYDGFIKDLSGNPLLSIYEVRQINDF